MRFIGVDENGSVGGMISKIEENIPNEFVSIKHVGMIENGVEDTASEKVKKWAGALEEYRFKDQDGGTLLIVDTDTEKEYVEMFNDMWPKSLQVLKELSEK
jgi:hypothetical protein